MTATTIEVCVASPADAIAAQSGGADRVELNCALTAGGLTPSAGLIDATLQAIELPVVAMIRPRAAGFCYSGDEFNVMLADIDVALDRGVAGIAFGILTDGATVDVLRCKAVVERTNAVDIVFHRAFDVTLDPTVALEQLIDLGLNRVMTSGQQATAMDGADVISQLREQAAGRVEVLPASGISPANAAELLRRTGCHQIHGSFKKQALDVSTSARDMGFGTQYPVTDAALVRAVREAVDSAGTS